MRLWNELVCEILKVPAFVGRVFYILIRNLEIQIGVSEKEITDLKNGSRNALWVTGLIIDSVHFLTEKSKVCFKLGTNSPVKKQLSRESNLDHLPGRPAFRPLLHGTKGNVKWEN